MWLRVQLIGYNPDHVYGDVPAEAIPVGITWGETLNMSGIEIPSSVTSGKESWMRYYLSQSGPFSEEHMLLVKLVDEQDQVQGNIKQVIPSGIPPSSNQPNKIFAFDSVLDAPAGVIPGNYKLLVQLVRTRDGFTVPMDDGSLEVLLGEVAVQAASCDIDDEYLPAESVTDVKFGGELRLRGHSSSAKEIRPGLPLFVDSWWCAEDQPRVDYGLRLQLQDGDGSIVAASTQTLGMHDHPPTSWKSGDLIKDTSSLIPPAAAVEGDYELLLSLVDPNSGKPLKANWFLGPEAVSLGNVVIAEWPFQDQIPEIPVPFAATFDDPPLAEFEGYELQSGGVDVGDTVSAGAPLEITLFWRSLTDSISTGYTVFVHLTDAEDNILGQSDMWPVGGTRPTTSWREDERFVDRHVFEIPGDAQVGDYLLWVGLFDAETGVRLPVFVNGKEQPDGRLLLQTLNVEN